MEESKIRIGIFLINKAFVLFESRILAFNMDLISKLGTVNK